MKVCVFGAGAIGGHLAARAAQNGADVSVLARGAHLAAIRAGGLRIIAPGEDFTVSVPASEDPAALGPQDAVIVAVKQTALPSVARTIAPLLGPETAVAFVMNGIPWWYYHSIGGPDEGRQIERLDPDGLLHAAVGPERAIGGTVYCAAAVPEPGVIKVETLKGRLVLGEPSGADTPRLKALLAALDGEHFAAVGTPRIRDEVWTKLITNLSTGPIAMLTQQRIDRIVSDPAALEAAETVANEIAAVARAHGVEPLGDRREWLRRSRKLPHKPSILQDLERGRPMEIEAIYNVPLEMAREKGVSTPLTRLLVSLAALRVRAAEEDA